MTMKTLYLHIVIAGILSSNSTKAATLLLDDFAVGSFLLTSESASLSSGIFVTEITNQRTIAGDGLPNWTVTLSQGLLNFNVNQVDASRGRTHLDLIYSLSSGTFSLTSYDAFAVDLFNVVGIGELVLSVNRGAGDDIRIPINGSGTLISPFSNVRTSQSLDSLTVISFGFSSISDDFSLSIDNVRVIPEPSSFLLLFIGIAGTTFYHRRRE